MDTLSTTNTTNTTNTTSLSPSPSSTAQDETVMKKTSIAIKKLSTVSQPIEQKKMSILRENMDVNNKHLIDISSASQPCTRTSISNSFNDSKREEMKNENNNNHQQTSTGTAAVNSIRKPSEIVKSSQIIRHTAEDVIVSDEVIAITSTEPTMNNKSQEEQQLISSTSLPTTTSSALEGDDGHVSTNNSNDTISSSSVSAAIASTEEEEESKICNIPNIKVQMKYGSSTDIGGNKTNQDVCDILNLPPNIIMLCMFDGHGPELGELAAATAKNSFRLLIKTKGMIDRIRENPTEALTYMFKAAHEDIRKAFRDKYLKQRWEVMDTPEGYLIKRQNKKFAWTCTHGGTTATVIVILDGRRMIVANVGDSSAIWGMKNEDGKIVYKELIGDHSPESIDEYYRVLSTKPKSQAKSPSSSLTPDLQFVYDSLSTDNYQSKNIFKKDADDPSKIKKTGSGAFYKNVRNEWASIVSTPVYAKYQDSLAFTRSLGDFHIHSYGVSEIPTVFEYDLVKLQASVKGGSSTKKIAEGIEVSNESSVLILATDGVWDNWKYEDIISQALKADITKMVADSPDAQHATDLVMKANVSVSLIISSFLFLLLKSCNFINTKIT